MAELAPEEVDLRGNWIVQKDRSVVADTTEQRIEWLTTQKLERIAKDWSGWETLYPRPERLPAMGADVSAERDAWWRSTSSPRSFTRRSHG